MGENDGILVSVIVPVYNIDKYVGQCVESIIKQTYINIEIILVNDGSTDESGKICENYAQIDSRIKVVNKENKGLVSARKKGLDVSTGEFIIFVDGDDWAEDRMVEILLKTILEGQFDMVQCAYFEEGNKAVPRRREDRIYSNLSEIDRRMLLEEWLTNDREISNTIWAKIFRRQIVNESYFGVPDTMNIGEDLVNHIRLIPLIKNARIIATELYHYRVRKGSLSSGERDGLERGLQHEVVTNYIAQELLNDKLGISRDAITDWVMKRNREYIAKHDKCFTETYYKYLFSEVEILFDKKIVLYGAGKVGKDYYKKICLYERCNIVAWVDNNYQNIELEYHKINPVNYIKRIYFDYIIVAVADEKVALEIIDDLVNNYGIDIKSIVWKKPILNY